MIMINDPRSCGISNLFACRFKSYILQRIAVFQNYHKLVKASSEEKTFFKNLIKRLVNVEYRRCLCISLFQNWRRISDSAIMKLVDVLSKLYSDYGKTTPQRLKLVDAYLFYIMLTGVIQFVYCCLVGTFPFNSFLAGFISCVGSFVLAGKSCSVFLHLHPHFWCSSIQNYDQNQKCSKLRFFSFCLNCKIVKESKTL